MLRLVRSLFGSRHARDDEPVKLIVGLGNPGKEYERTRHNVGWWVLDHLADVWHFEGWKKEGEARVVTGQVGPHKVRLVKPLTYMNLSGAVLQPYLRRAFWSPKVDLLVIVDEVALPIGRFRFRARGSAGGHNGLKSIERAIGNQDYPRLRVGIGPADPAQKSGDLAEFVLDEFEDAEAERVRALFPTLTEGTGVWVSEGIERVMNRYNGRDEGRGTRDGMSS